MIGADGGGVPIGWLNTAGSEKFDDCMLMEDDVSHCCYPKGASKCAAKANLMRKFAGGQVNAGGDKVATNFFATAHRGQLSY